MAQKNSGDYCLLLNEEAGDAIRQICRISKSEEEVHNRIVKELNYPYETIVINSTSVSKLRRKRWIPL